ncbi:hypothetical protein ACFSJ3_16930 [Corallincola platygyrae]|uniref:DUF4194 domain-containing protein n=1 Tax=Corallincola platygyrae TaxID=1193278 RepID=A0ABW4XT33_9GAMM
MNEHDNSLPFDDELPGFSDIASDAEAEAEPASSPESERQQAPLADSQAESHSEDNQAYLQQNAQATSTNPFERIPAALSAAIYRDLTYGRVIGKNIYDELKSELIGNPLFTLLFNEQLHFTQLYQHLGYELVLDASGEFFYIRELLDDGLDEADENAFKTQVVLLLLGRFYSRSGRDLALLAMADVGLDENDIRQLERESEYLDILRAAKFQKGWNEALEFLVTRRFAWRVGEKRYFISDAGNAFLSRLLEAYQRREQES